MMEERGEAGAATNCYPIQPVASACTRRGAAAALVQLKEAKGATLQNPLVALGVTTLHSQSFNVTRSRPASSITSVFFSSERLS